MRSTPRVRTGIAVLVLSILATGCIVAPYGGGRDGGGYGHERHDERGDRGERHLDGRHALRDGAGD